MYNSYEKMKIFVWGDSAICLEGVAAQQFTNSVKNENTIKKNGEKYILMEFPARERLKEMEKEKSSDKYEEKAF